MLVAPSGALLRAIPLPSDVGFISLNYFAKTAHRRAHFGWCHGFAYPHRHEPSGAIGNPELAMKLMSRNTFLARGHQVKTERPFGERDMAGFHNAAGHDCERAFAAVAMDKAGAVRLAVQPVNLLR